MNYIELINQFWKLDRERPFTASDTRLYFYLVQTCNALGWKNPFGHSDRHLAVNVSVSVNTLRKAKQRLIAAGLIYVETPEKPSNNINGQTKYTILSTSKNELDKKISVSKNDTVYDTVHGTVSDTVTETNYKHNENKTKENIKSEFEIFQNSLTAKFPTVAKMEHQLSLAEYTSFFQEFHLTPVAFKNLLQRMENYKPLLEKSTSVYLTLRSWQLNDLKNATEIHNKTCKAPVPTRKQTIINEGKTL